MFRSFAFSVLSLLAFNASAEDMFQQSLPIYCGNDKKMLEGIKKEYDEEITFLAADKTDSGDDLFHSLWVNHEKGTWTFLAYNRPKKTICVLASGINGKAFAPPSI
jgi:hypothetical protein